MSHVITFTATTATDYVIDLRRFDQAGTALVGKNYWKACKIKVTAKQTGGAKSTCNVAPIIVNDGDDPPAAAPISLAASPKGLAILDSTLFPSVEIGQNYGPGYSSFVFKEIVGTHLLVTGTATGAVEIVVD
jgi:hypothetical protein